MSEYTLSKTSFLKLEQCHKAFFLYKNHPYLRDKVSIDKQLTFRRGHEVGNLARQLFPDGKDASADNKTAIQAVEATKQLIQSQESVIYEAAFIQQGVLIMVDILVLEEGVYKAYEVKSSIKVTETYLKDAYLQYYVLKQNFQNFEDLFLVTVNSDYILENVIEPKKMFKKRSVKQNAEKNLEYYNHQINTAGLLLEQNVIPNTSIGTHCFKPYVCDFFGTCWKGHSQPNSIFNMPFTNKATIFNWFSSGITEIKNIPLDENTKPEIHKIKSCFSDNLPFIDSEKIAELIDQVKAPYAALDMEIWNPAIPQIKGTRPFEQIPFLVCLYNGNESEYFFTDYQADERRSFAENLIQITSNYSTLLTYDKTMEENVINSLAKKNPDLLEALEGLKSKLVDVFGVFLNLQYYHPAFGNNFSLKAVSQVLLPELQYTKINSGLEAMAHYDKYRSSMDLIEKEELKQDIISYCNTDCLATYGLFSSLKHSI